MMTTERADCTFVVKEDSDGRPSLAIEPRIAGFNIAFKLREGATIDETNDDARTLALGGPGETRAENPLCRQPIGC